MYDRFVFRHKDPHLDPKDYQYYSRCVARLRQLNNPLFVLHRTGLTDHVDWSFCSRSQLTTQGGGEAAGTGDPNSLARWVSLLHF